MLTKDELRIIETALRDGGLLLSFRWHDEADKAVVAAMVEKGYLVDSLQMPNAYTVSDVALQMYYQARPQTFTAGEWQTRPLNEITITGSIIVTLPAGTYRIHTRPFPRADDEAKTGSEESE